MLEWVVLERVVCVCIRQVICACKGLMQSEPQTNVDCRIDLIRSLVCKADVNLICADTCNMICGNGNGNGNDNQIM